MRVEKNSDVNTRVVAVFKLAVFATGCRYCLKLYAVLEIVHQKHKDADFVDIDVNLGSAVNCRKNPHGKLLDLTPTVLQGSGGRAG